MNGWALAAAFLAGALTAAVVVLWPLLRVLRILHAGQVTS